MQRGLTVLELVVILVVLALLGSVVAFIMTKQFAKSRDMQRVETVQRLQKSLALFYVDRNEFPTTQEPLALTGEDRVTTALTETKALIGFEPDPLSPQFDYLYEAPTPGAYTITFCIETTGVPPYEKGCLNTIAP